jgi:hypothetical protein
MRCLTLQQWAILEGLIVAIWGILSSIMREEIRQFVKLTPPTPPPPRGPVQEFSWVIWIYGLAIIIFFFVWLIACGISPAEPIAFHAPTSTCPSPAPTPTPIKQIGPIGSYPPVEIEGSEFTLYMFSIDYHWKYGTLRAEFNKELIVKQQIIEYFKDLKGTIFGADAIICVGTASFDLRRDEALEEGRALTRAQQLSIWIRPAISGTGKNVDVYELNLGHYREPPDDDNQRPIALVSVKRIDQRRPLQEQLSEAQGEHLKQEMIKERFPFPFETYSLFQLRKAS